MKRLWQWRGRDQIGGNVLIRASAINIYANARVDGHDKPIGRLDLLAFEVESLAQFPKASGLDSSFPRHMCGDLNFPAIGVGQNARVEPG